MEHSNDKDQLVLEDVCKGVVDLHYAPSTVSLPSKKKKCCILSLILMAILLLVVTVATIVILSMIPYLLRNHQTPPPHQIIHQTTEYQIDFSHREDWKEREAMMNEWIDYFEKKSKYFSVAESTVASSSRTQYYIDATTSHRCNMDYEIRVRDYTEGSATGTSTVDIKANSHFQSVAASYPLWPADEYQEESSQKVERDEHSCGHKYSRESRVFLDSPNNFRTCSDLIELFPYAFEKITDHQLSHEVKIHELNDWYLREYSGYLDKDTKYKIAFTLRYDVGQNVEGNKPNGGEWSIRVYTKEDSGSEYNTKVIKDVESAWKSLMRHFDDTDC